MKGTERGVKGTERRDERGRDRETGETGGGSMHLTCDAAAPNGEKGQFKPPPGFAGPGGQNELICVLEQTQVNIYDLSLHVIGNVTNQFHMY